MAIFQHPLWGFALDYPADWVHQSNADVDGFARDGAAFELGLTNHEMAAHVLVRGEWNATRQPIAPLWNQHITKLSIMVGAKKLGASPFHMGGATGFEAEIQLPQRHNRRLWTGILTLDTIILHLMVSHPNEERKNFEPQATALIASLRFLKQVEGLQTNAEDLPLPPQYTPASPAALVPDAHPGDGWQAYTGSSSIGGLQAFYYRELPNYGWEIREFIPFPNQVAIEFARLRIQKGLLSATLGILPGNEKQPLGSIVVRYD